MKPVLPYLVIRTSYFAFHPSYLVFLCFLLSSSYTLAQKRIARSAKELNSFQLKPGDTVVLNEGTWTDEEMKIRAIGTSSQPVVVMAAAPGKVKLTGSSTLLIDGKWIVVDGLYFNDGVPTEDVVNFSDSASWCRLTNTAIVNCNPPDKKTSTRFVSLHGAHNRVDHCFFKGKTNHGPTLVVWLSEKPNYHRIDHNHFGFRAPLGENGGETIRIGTSTWSMYHSYTTVEYNLFDHCDGELEIISNKSCHNTMRYNTFFESKGTLTLRHGNDALVYGNIFIGNNIEGTGGIRIIGEDHAVFDNYFRGLTGKGVSAAISLVDGFPNSALNGYFQLKNAHVINNTIVQCAESFSIGIGKAPNRNLPPVDCLIANNYIVPGTTLITYNDTPVNLSITNNKLYTKTKTQPETGFIPTDPKLFHDPQSTLTKPNTTTPPLVEKNVGTSWNSSSSDH